LRVSAIHAKASLPVSDLPKELGVGQCVVFAQYIEVMELTSTDSCGQRTAKVDVSVWFRVSQATQEEHRHVEKKKRAETLL
jgi:hypothetical protein